MSNVRIMNVLNEHVKIIIEINQFNKFASKVIFVLLAFNASTAVFIVYNLIYVNLTEIAKYAHELTVFGVLGVIAITIINALRIPNQLQRNKRNLISLIYKKNLPIKTRIKVIDLLSIDNLTNYLFSCCH